MKASVGAELARWAAELRWDAIPEDVRRSARVTWLDTFGCMLYGATHPETSALSGMLAKAQPPSRDAVSTVGPAQKLRPQDAILVNGLATGVDVYDGGGLRSKGHVAGYLLAPVMAAAEAADASLGDALVAFVAGYEVASRIGAGTWLRDALHPSATWQTVGAAAAIGSLRRLNQASMCHAMELAANLTLTTSWEAMIQGANVCNLYHGLTGYMGLMAVDLASAGFRGASQSIEVTFGTELAGERDFDAAICLERLDEFWHLRDVYYKRYPICHTCFVVVDALRDVMAELPRPFDPARDSVRIGTNARAHRRNCRIENATDLAARTSLPVAVATCLIFGELGPSAFRDARYADPRVRPLGGTGRYRFRRLRGEPELGRAGPRSRKTAAHRFAARATTAWAIRKTRCRSRPSATSSCRMRVLDLGVPQSRSPARSYRPTSLCRFAPFSPGGWGAERATWFIWMLLTVEVQHDNSTRHLT